MFLWKHTKRLKLNRSCNFLISQPTQRFHFYPFFCDCRGYITRLCIVPENPSCVAQNKKKNENILFIHRQRQCTSGWIEREEMSTAGASVGKQEDWANMKNRYSLWMAFRDTSALEIYALMPSPIPRQICWHGDVGVCCKGTIWQSSMRLESQCAFFISLASTLARESEI